LPAIIFAADIDYFHVIITGHITPLSFIITDYVIFFSVFAD